MSQDSISEVAKEFNPEEHRAKWLKRLADEFEKLEPLMPIKLLPDGIEYPQWVLKVEREFSLVVLPSANLKDSDLKMTPKRMGALLGHTCGMAVWMNEWLNHQMTSDAPVNEASLGKRKLSEITEDEWEKGLNVLISLEVWYLALRRLAKRALCSCVDQTYDVMTDFLLGYADAFSRKPKTYQASNMGNPTFEIYVFMLTFWRLIEGMDSVRQLHETLVLTFGPRIGDLKRTEKICQRIGLSFRKPGRPKKLIQTSA
jgi:hypothetical protein